MEDPLKDRPLKPPAPTPSLFRPKKMGGRYAWLCGTLVTAILTGLPLREAGYGDLFGLFVVAILYSGANAATSAQRRRRTYVAMLTPIVAIDLWIMFVGGGNRLAAVGSLFHVCFLIFTGWAILGHISRQQKMTLDTILGGVSVFLLIGVIFGYTFSIVETVFPGSLKQSGQPLRATANARGQVERRPEAIYFSFVTLTTVGYGDIVPDRSMARVLAITEALTGQIFLTTFLAFLVGNYLAQREVEAARREHVDDEDDGPPRDDFMGG